MSIRAALALLPGLALALAAGVLTAAAPARAGSDAKTIRIDGSSTVYLITEAMAEEYRSVKPDVKVTVGIAGTGGGMKKFTAGELDIADASRPMKPKEIEGALAGGIAFTELPVAYDGISIVVNPKADWIDHLTLDELKHIWRPDGSAKTWADVRAGWPDRPIHLYGPGTDSGTFDYFTEAVVGMPRSSRSDYTASEDDNMLVQGVSGDKDGLGYFGFAYYEENQDKLKLVPIDSGKGAVTPSAVTIADGTYAPLSRPLFIYVRKTSSPLVRDFVKFYLDKAPSIASEVGYVPLPTEIYELARARWNANVIGSAMAKPGTMTLAQRYAK